jgi:amino acid permease
MLGKREYTDYETEFYVKFTSIGCSIEVLHLFSLLAVALGFRDTYFAAVYILATPAIILLLPRALSQANSGLRRRARAKELKWVLGEEGGGGDG